MNYLYFECTIYTTCLSCFVCLDSVGPSIAPTSNIHIFEDGKFQDNDYKIKFAFCSIWKLKETVIHWLSANGKFVVHRFSKIEWSYVWLVECTRCNCTHWLTFQQNFIILRLTIWEQIISCLSKRFTYNCEMIFSLRDLGKWFFLNHWEPRTWFLIVPIHWIVVQ